MYVVLLSLLFTSIVISVSLFLMSRNKSSKNQEIFRKDDNISALSLYKDLLYDSDARVVGSSFEITPDLVTNKNQGDFVNFDTSELDSYKGLEVSSVS